jgi:hypothetical protein
MLGQPLKRTSSTSPAGSKALFMRSLARAICGGGVTSDGPAGAPLKGYVAGGNAVARTGARPGYNSGPLRGRLMVGRLTLDQVVKVRVLAPQPQKAPAQGGFLVSGIATRVRMGQRRGQQHVALLASRTWTRPQRNGSGD